MVALKLASLLFIAQCLQSAATTAEASITMHYYKDTHCSEFNSEFNPIEATCYDWGYAGTHSAGADAWSPSGQLRCRYYSDFTCEEGFDVAFVANYLGHWLLTLLLLQVMDREHGRIVVVGSDAYECVPNFSAIAGPSREMPKYLTGSSVTAPFQQLDGYYKDEKWKLFFRESNIDAVAYGRWSSNRDDFARHAGVRRYGVAKMCLVMMIAELQRRLDVDPSLGNIAITGIDPGVMSTGLARRGNWITRVVIWPIILRLLAPFLTWWRPNGLVRTISKSAADVLKIASDPTIEVRGQFFNGSEVQAVVPEAADTQKRLMVWRDSVKYVNLSGSDTPLVNWS
ncbi:hypothetical protein B0I35DRAFT_483884 [Stachybotrys elegans]|uniref:Uncharacterized protein n=1 Tax=Stachybotrys elegans TaxID=80388 RepID=A0A8K0SER5_9HYPO|nr:hypothetical protein B0I35DRAFT_483884 [Stachybotrys elegans]